MSQPAELRVEAVSKSFGDVPVLRELSLTVPAGSTLAMLGPSGCGKSTLLRVVAGLEAPDEGTVAVGGRQLTSGRDVTPPERRQVGLVFQDWALFPHLSVAENVAYGLRGVDAAERSRRVGEALGMVGMADLGDRSPATLSGGQQQRVALARAFAPRPSVLLLDEPFSNLDVSLRAQVRTEVHALLRQLGVTTVFVTHDQEEAFVLGDEVAVMRDGRIVQRAAPTVVYARPADPWVAEFVGDANLLAGEADGDWAVTVVGPVRLAEPAAGAVDVLVRPEQLAVAPDLTGTARVELVEYYGHDTMSMVRLDDGQLLRVRSPGAPAAGHGARVSVSYDGTAGVAYPARTPSPL